MGIINRLVQKYVEPAIKEATTKAVSSAVKKSSFSQEFELGNPVALELFGINQTTVPNPYSQNPSVYKAVKAITDNVPQTEIKFYEKSDPDGEAIPFDKLDKHIQRLFTKPNPIMNIKEYIQYFAGFIALNGESITIKIKSQGQVAGSSQAPAELLIDNPARFKEVKDSTTGMRTGWIYKNREYKNDEVIYSRDFNNLDVNRGLSPNVPLKVIIESDNAARNYNKKFFDNDTTPSVAVETEKQLSEKQRTRIEDWFRKKYQGIKNAFKFVVLEQGLKLRSVAPSHKDMLFDKQTKFSREEILGTYRTPKALFNITDDLNYATFIGQMKIFWVYTLAPILRKIEYSLNSDLIKQIDDKIIMRFDFSNVPAFKEDFADKVTTGKLLQEMGHPINDINRKLQLGMEEQAWGNDWWVGFSQVPAGSVPVVPEGDAKGAKKIVKGIDPAKAERLFMVHHHNIEKGFTPAISKYFFEQRKIVLAEINEKSIDKAVTKINWAEEDKKLIKISAPYISEGVKAGATIAGTLTNIALNDVVLQTLLSSITTERAQLITRINDTVRDQLNVTLNAGIVAGETVQQISDRVRDVYNIAGNRAKIIARTETTAAMNASSMSYYDKAGVRNKQWVTAGDERVRSSHMAMNGNIIPITASFANGVITPGVGGSAAETINCRCTIIPVIES